MAKIWPVYEGQTPTAGFPWANLPLREAIALFGLRPDDFLSDPETTPRFGAVDRDLTYAGFKHIVVEVERNEGRQAKWKPGFYASRVKPDEAFRRLMRQAIAVELGEENVLQLNWKPTTDSRGQEALRINVVIAPEAAEKLKSGAVLDALVGLQKRLREMGEDRIPIVDYATEAELRQDAGP